MMKLRECGETWVSQENGHFSLNNGANSSWIRNSAISYEKKKYKIDLYTNTRKCCLLLFKEKYALVYCTCTLKYKSNILINKTISGNLFVTISASARGFCTRKCEQILCTGTFISTNGCLYNFFVPKMIHSFYFGYFC